MKHRIGRLHIITDTRGDKTHAALAAAALAGGADVVQMRDKVSTTRFALEAARAVAELCRKWHRPLIINDRIDVALGMDAEGVHLGDDDLPIEIARSLLGPERIIGSSADTVSEVDRRVKSGADYVGIGPIFETTSKGDAGPVLGLDGLAEVVKRTSIPLIAIGGITLENVSEVLQTGVYGIAVLSAVCQNSDPEGVTRRFQEILSTQTLNSRS